MMLDTLTPGSASDRGWLAEAGRPAPQHAAVEPSLLGVDVGFAKDARSTGLAWRANGVIGACKTGSTWSARSFSLPAGITFDLAALDAPLVPAGPGMQNIGALPYDQLRRPGDRTQAVPGLHVYPARPRSASQAPSERHGVRQRPGRRQPLVAMLGHRLLIVGQDFSNVDYFRQHGGRDAPGNETNENLYRLLTQGARIPVGRLPVSDPDAAVYLTNSILCLKDGEMKAKISGRWINNCCDTHLAPLVGLLRPRVVVGMGSGGWRAVRRLFGLKREPPGVMAVAGMMWEVGGTLVFAVGHCGGLGLRNKPREQQAADWRKIGEAIASLPDGNEHAVLE